MTSSGGDFKSEKENLLFWYIFLFIFYLLHSNFSVQFSPKRCWKRIDWERERGGGEWGLENCGRLSLNEFPQFSFVLFPGNSFVMQMLMLTMQMMMTRTIIMTIEDEDEYPEPIISVPRTASFLLGNIIHQLSDQLIHQKVYQSID